VSVDEAPVEYLFAIAALVVGAGTVLYHASLTFVGQTLDVFGMYLLVTMIGLSIVTRRYSLSARVTVAFGIVINILLLVLLVAAPEYRRIVFAGLVVLVIALESSESPPRERGGRQVFWLAAAILAGGFAVWALDYARFACSPTSWLQGHAVWHLCGAAAVWFTMRYYAVYEKRVTA
jgi:dihydroceramidase